jgi:hypothetical protein
VIQTKFGVRFGPELRFQRFVTAFLVLTRDGASSLAEKEAGATRGVPSLDQVPAKWRCVIAKVAGGTWIPDLPARVLNRGLEVKWYQEYRKCCGFEPWPTPHPSVSAAVLPPGSSASASAASSSVASSSAAAPKGTTKVVVDLTVAPQGKIAPKARPKPRVAVAKGEVVEHHQKAEAKASPEPVTEIRLKADPKRRKGKLVSKRKAAQQAEAAAEAARQEAEAAASEAPAAKKKKTKKKKARQEAEATPYEVEEEDEQHQEAEAPESDEQPGLRRSDDEAKLRAAALATVAAARIKRKKPQVEPDREPPRARVRLTPRKPSPDRHSEPAEAQQVAWAPIDDRLGPTLQYEGSVGAGEEGARRGGAGRGEGGGAATQASPKACSHTGGLVT